MTESVEQPKVRSKKRKTLIFLGAFIALIVIVGGAFFEITSSPEFCASCHNMKPYVDSWKASSHSQVQCAQCHYEPGTWNYVKGKVTDGQVHLVMFMFGRTKGRYHAEISDLSCRSCHSDEQLNTPKDFKGVSFSHTNHLATMRRNKKLRCVTCHGQLVQGEHLTVDNRDCFICHFKQDENGERDPKLSDCRTCHQEVPSAIELGDVKTFEHARYIENGVVCTTCHVGIVQGAGAVNYDHCMECHAEPEKSLKNLIAEKYTIEEYHLNHVTNHKVECWRCHDMIRHESVRNPTAERFDVSCTTCHTTEQHSAPRQLYRGTGGKGVADMPASMYLASVDCASCHRNGDVNGAHRSATDMGQLGMGQSCIDCHGAGYDAMLTRWKEVLFERNTLVEGRVVKAESLAAAAGDKMTDELKEALSEARYNVDFVRRARGHHNVQYALALLDDAGVKSEQVLSKLGATSDSGFKPFELNCTNLCHAEMETRTVMLGSTPYPHKKHVVDQGFDCQMCHGSDADHGKTKMVTCSGCHHGGQNGNVPCADCHRDVAELIQGKGAATVTGTPDTMASALSCADCHTQVATGQTTTVEGVRAACVGCHDAEMAAKLDEWLAWGAKIHDPMKQKLDDLKKTVDAKREGHANVVKLDNRIRAAEADLALLANGKVVHNPAYVEAIQKEVEGLLVEIQTLLSSPE